MSAKAVDTKSNDDDFDNLFEGIGNEVVPSKGGPKSRASKVSNTSQGQSEQDLLAELENLGAAPMDERPHTPRLATTANAGGNKGSTAKRTATETPQTGSARTSEEKPAGGRKSVDSTRSSHATFTPSATSSDSQEVEKKEYIPPAEAQPAVASGGGWWGGLLATATAAVKTAEAAVKEIQQNEEAKKWAEQVKGNVGALRGLGGELSSRALPTFTNILHTLAPPISSHERLQIHITHDLIGYPSLEPLIYTVFSRVMAQVEGGDLLVLQRGHESGARRGSDAGYRGGGGSGGWNDGPWWRQAFEHRDLGTVKGLVEGTKLVRVSAEAYSQEYFTSHGGLDAAVARATENLSESNPVRSSDIFLAVQAITHHAANDLFQGATTKEPSEGVAEDESTDELVTFALYLLDPVHSITYHTLTQSVPARWIKWLDAPAIMTPQSSSSPSVANKSGFFGGAIDDEKSSPAFLPEEIAEIMEHGGVDPREWVAEWIEEILNTGVGVVAQRYVARRMGVGEGGLGKGKARMEEVVGDNGGEAARAGII